MAVNKEKVITGSKDIEGFQVKEYETAVGDSGGLQREGSCHVV